MEDGVWKERFGLTASKTWRGSVISPAQRRPTRCELRNVSTMAQRVLALSGNVMTIREATAADFDRIWPIFHEIAVAGETYAYPQDITKEQALKIWIDGPRKTYVWEEDGEIFGTYYIKTNQAGPGDHVCNCAYMVSPAARGRGLATAMCEHSQEIARELGYKAMQFNFVVSSNEGAVRLWTKLGFATVGQLPRVFRHPSKGYVDALVMYKWLET
jgi:L-amino acid N-acyltransferase YncA